MGPAATVTTTPSPPTCASFKCGAGSYSINKALVCANRDCSQKQCCQEDPCAPQNLPNAPVPTLALAPAAKYDAKEESLVQSAVAPKSGASTVSAWVMPFFGVLALFSCAAFAASAHRRRSVSRRVRM